MNLFKRVECNPILQYSQGVCALNTMKINLSTSQLFKSQQQMKFIGTIFTTERPKLYELFKRRGKIKRKEDSRDGVPSSTFRDTYSITMEYYCVKYPFLTMIFCLTLFDGCNKVNAYKIAASADIQYMTKYNL